MVGKAELSCHTCFNFSRLRSGSSTLHSDSSPPLVFTCFMIIDLHEIFECTHLKFTVSVRSKQTNKPTSIDTHMRAQCSHASACRARSGSPQLHVETLISYLCMQFQLGSKWVISQNTIRTCTLRLMGTDFTGKNMSMPLS